MLSYTNIRSIAKYERKILLRSWFFRIFAILSLFIIGMYSGVTVFESNPWNWAFRSLPSAMIYSNMFLLNIFQSVIAVFLATDFLKRDKKLNTSEVLFIRPMTNSEYILGKTSGLLSVFIILDFLVMMLSSIFLMVSKQIEFQILPVIYYFLLVCIPTLVFIVGLSYTIMVIVKNQPIAFILLLGYIALVLFYLGEKMNYIFDYMVFVKPLVFSDIIGFSNIEDILLHRLSYFILGVGFIYFTIWRLNRLPNRKSSNYIVGAVSFILLGVAAWGLSTIYVRHEAQINERAMFVTESEANFNRKVPEMTHASIKFKQGEILRASSKMSLKNNTSELIDTLVFSLNPGLKVTKVILKQSEIDFIQKGLIIELDLKEALNPNDETEVEISYEGIPNFNIVYLDNKDEDVLGYKRVMQLRINRDYGFYTNKYVLLTKENLWYPIPGIAYDPTRPAIFRQQFTKFSLEVEVDANMLPISQGARSTKDSVSYKFDVRDPIPQLSLTIGEYEELTVDMDGIDVRLAHFKTHDGFKESLSELGDTVVDLTLEFLDDYERPLGMYYPYNKFTLVETPVQFASHPHSWTSTLAESQPQLVFFPEFGFNVRSADFNSSKKRIERDSKRNKEGLSDKEIQSRIYTNFLKNVFAEENADTRFGDPSEAGKSNPYNIFPNYFYYVNYITSDECPVLNYAFESYLMSGEDDPRSMFMQRMQGIGDIEKANLKLKEESLKQIIATEDQEVVSRVLSAKGSYLLTWMEKQINNPGFNDFLRSYLYDYSYVEIKYNELAAAISKEYNVELGSFINDWYTSTKLPSFGIGSYEAFEVIDNSQAMFVVRNTITNYSDVDGMVKFTIMLGGGRGRGGFSGGGQETDERIYLVEANTTKEIQMVLSQSPRMILFNTLLSENIPASMMGFGIKPKKNKFMKAIEYEKIVNDPVSIYNQGELIVDNTDEGFTAFDPALSNPLRKFVESKKNKEEDSGYVGTGWGQGPATWGVNADSDYFGEVIHSAMMVRSGEGSKTATWKHEIPVEGYYDVFVYGKHQRNRRRGRGGPDQRNDVKGTYHYTVQHDDGMEEIPFEVKDFETGWNLLGSFYISSDSASVVLSDAGGADRVIADAVKWVRQK